jgi:hypothetical protein
MDLFPRHFIESLKTPSNYFGPTRVFGLASEDDDAVTEPLPIFRAASDYEYWMPDKHKKHWTPPAESFPVSLRHSVMAFLLVCAARRARGQSEKHNSMLIHTTRFQDVQRRVSEQVEELLTTTRYRLRYGDGEGPNVWDECGAIWQADFMPTTSAWDNGVEALPWESVRAHITQAVDKVEVRTINGTSRDALEYYEHRDTGLSVIAIGGDKLSRGLTLEGLSVSYYLRATRMYDTLMQMGRWFGYRPGYEDLCRLYTTPTLFSWYREITAASEELRADFDDMATRRATPEQYGLRVRQSPAGLSVTSPSKMRSATSVTLTFSGDISETVTFDTEPTTLDHNRQLLESFIAQLVYRAGEPEASKGNRVWTSVDGSLIADEFFQGYRAEKMAHRARPELIARYIRDAVKLGELTDWTVVLISNTQPRDRATVAGLDIGLTFRRPLNGEADVVQSGRYTIRRVLSPTDETIDFSEEQRQAALAALRVELEAKATPEKPFKEPEYPRGATLRRQRHPENGLLLIYLLDHVDKENATQLVAAPMVAFAVSFPFSKRNATVKYQVNEIWRLMAFDDLVDDDDQ